MMDFVIKEKNWKDFSDVKVECLKPYWLKLSNGNIVLSVYVSNRNNSGWAKVFIGDDYTLQVSGNEFYLSKGAKIQEVSEV